MLETIQLMQRYYAAFNAGDAARMRSLLTADVLHGTNEEATQTGLELFRRFLGKMNTYCREQAQGLGVMATPDGQRAAAEFVIYGKDLTTAQKPPEAAGQKYGLRVGNFFEIRQDQIARCKLADWTRQVGGAQ